MENFKQLIVINDCFVNVNITSFHLSVEPYVQFSLPSAIQYSFLELKKLLIHKYSFSQFDPFGVVRRNLG